MESKMVRWRLSREFKIKEGNAGGKLARQRRKHGMGRHRLVEERGQHEAADTGRDLWDGLEAALVWTAMKALGQRLACSPRRGRPPCSCVRVAAAGRPSCCWRCLRRARTFEAALVLCWAGIRVARQLAHVGAGLFEPTKAQNSGRWRQFTA